MDDCRPAPQEAAAALRAAMAALPQPEGARLLAGGKRRRFHCDYCRRDITGGARVHCAVCPDFDLCPECFSAGVELAPHERSHAYQVSDSLDAPLFCADWTAAEEVLLIEGIQAHGFGNWRQVADYVGSKSAARCEAHYKRDYLGSPNGIVPPFVVLGAPDPAAPGAGRPSIPGAPTEHPDGLGPFGGAAATAATPVPAAGGAAAAEKLLEAAASASSSQEGAAEPAAKRARSEPPAPAADAAVAAAAASAASSAVSSSASAASSAGEPATPAAAPAAGAGAAPAGAGAAPAAAGAPPKVQGKGLVGYMPLRGDFDVEYDNDAELILADMEFHDDDHPAERELKLRIVAIYNSKLDERERRKRFVLERGLLDYKRQQTAERRRPKDERDLVAAMRVFARFHSPEEHDTFVEGLLTALRLKRRIAELQHYRALGIRTLPEAERYELERRKRESDLALRKQRQSTAYLYDGGRTPVDRSRSRARGGGGSEDVAMAAAAADDEDGSGADAAAAASDAAAATAAAAAAAAAAASAEPTPLDISRAPGVELLSPKEREFCSTLRLLPKHYLSIKDVLLRESARLGYVGKGSARQLLKVDASTSNRVFDFFVSCGWVSAEP